MFLSFVNINQQQFLNACFRINYVPPTFIQSTNYRDYCTPSKAVGSIAGKRGSMLSLALSRLRHASTSKFSLQIYVNRCVNNVAIILFKLSLNDCEVFSRHICYTCLPFSQFYVCDIYACFKQRQGFMRLRQIVKCQTFGRITCILLNCWVCR